MYKVLLVEDDPGIGKTVEFNLKDEGYEVYWAKNLRDARAIYNDTQVDIILLDIGLPDGIGLDLCKEVRETNKSIPILVLTATIEEESAVKSFEFGADDYIRKPFGLDELMARVKRHLAIPMTREVKIKFQDLTILPEKREAFCQDKLLQLNRREFDILLCLVNNPDRVMSRTELLDKLGISEEVSDRTIDSQVSHLRAVLKKVGDLDHKISSVYGVGYKLEKN